MSSNWRKSSYSSGNGDNCIEVASDGVITVRDTTDRSGVTLSLPAPAWTAFLATI
jgi:hypothetical protein